MEQDFIIKINGEEVDQYLEKSDFVPLTKEQIDLSYAKKAKDAVNDYDPQNRDYSVYLKDDTVVSGVDYSTLETLSASPQSNLENTVKIINICRQLVNWNDIVGLTNACIENNTNTEVRLSYKRAKKGVRNKSDIEAVKQTIDDFNEKIDLSTLIMRAVSTTYRDGTFIACLRKREGKSELPDYIVDYYPVGVASVSDYEVGNQPYIQIDIKELKTRLQKNYPKTKKRKGLYFDTMLDEIEATYPPEVVKAYKENEQYAKLPVELTCVLRINNQNKRFGLSPIFRALPDILMLDAFAKADRTNAKARAKKIIAQYLHKEILGESYERNSYEQMSVGHKNLLDAWKQPTVVVTCPAFVDRIEYVEPKAPMTEIELMRFYREKAFATLGIGFLADNGSSSISIANISLRQLTKIINTISKQLEVVLQKWYRVVIRDAGLDVSLSPTISIIDSEMMEMSMKKDLVELLYSKLNFSLDTVADILGFSLEDERTKREAENKEKLDEAVFYPRFTAYTNSGKSGSGSGGGSGGGGGRKPNDTTDDPQKNAKQSYDRDLYKEKKESQ